MSLIEEQDGEWHFRVRRSRLCAFRDARGVEYIGVAKRAPFVAPDIGQEEPGEIWFEFGPTPAGVLAKLKAEVLTDPATLSASREPR